MFWAHWLLGTWKMACQFTLFSVFCTQKTRAWPKLQLDIDLLWSFLPCTFHSPSEWSSTNWAPVSVLAVSSTSDKLHGSQWCTQQWNSMTAPSLSAFDYNIHSSRWLTNMKSGPFFAKTQWASSVKNSYWRLSVWVLHDVSGIQCSEAAQERHLQVGFMTQRWCFSKIQHWWHIL